MAPDGRLRPIWRFLFSVVFVIFAPAFVAQWIIGAPIENDLLRDVVVTFSTAFFSLLASLFLLTTFDEMRGGLRQQMRELGFVGGRRAVIDTALGLLVGFVLITLAISAIALFGRIRPARVPITFHAAARGLVMTAWLIVAALSEELQFRLYPFKALRESIGPVLAAIFLSLGFGLVHKFNPSFGRVALFNTALIGGLLAMAYLRTRTVWMVWALHFSWNFTLGVIYGLPVSGFSFAVVVKSVAVGHRWLTGGSYGIEASITGAIVILIGYPIVWWLTRSQARELARLNAQAATPAGVDDLWSRSAPDASKH
jgi:membrane protease YdiL (CAAX protease family)